jgi:hypothetical protein
MDIALVQGTETLVLNGSGITGTYKAARFINEGLSELEVVLEGAAAAIGADLALLGCKVYEAGRVWGSSGEAWVYLVVTLPDSSQWRSPIRSGSVELVRGVGGRRLNSQVARLRLSREAWWEAVDAVWAVLNNQHGSGTSGGVTVYNHSDSGHDGFVSIAGVTGDLPAPARLYYQKSGVGNVELYAGMGTYIDRAQFYSQLEGEDAVAGGSGAGVTLTATANAACSNGSYGALAWNGTSEVQLKYWSPNGAWARAGLGRVFRPLVRLQSLVGGTERFWCSLAFNYDYLSGREEIWRSEGVMMPTDRLLFALPPVTLPPWLVRDDPSMPVTPSLQVTAEAAGAHTMNLDYLAFLPCDSYLRLLPVITNYAATMLDYDCATGVLVNNNVTIGSHAAEGPGLLVVPGKSQRLHFQARAGTLMDITMNPTVKLSYRPRKATL